MPVLCVNNSLFCSHYRMPPGPEALPAVCGVFTFPPFFFAKLEWLF